MRATFAFLSVLSLPLIAGDLPPDAAALKAKRDAKIAEVNQTYANELEKLQKLALKNGSLEAANAIEAEIAAAVPNLFASKDDSLRNVLNGTSWKIEGGEKVITFRSDGKISKSWGKLTPNWIVKNEVIEIEDSTFRMDAAKKNLIGKGGDKGGRWLKID